MRSNQIDLNKSLTNKRIVRNGSIITTITDLICNIILLFSFPISTGYYLIQQIQEQDNVIIAILIFLISLSTSGILYYSITNLDKLKKVERTNREINKARILDIAKDHNWLKEHSISTGDIIVFDTIWDSPSWSSGSQIIFILDINDILINVTTYGKGDLKSPFHWFQNRRLENVVIDNLSK